MWNFKVVEMAVSVNWGSFKRYLQDSPKTGLGFM